MYRYVTIPKDFRTELIEKKLKNKTSKYNGVSQYNNKKWTAAYMMNRKRIRIGYFDTELEACIQYNNTVFELNKKGCNYKINHIEITSV